MNTKVLCRIKRVKKYELTFLALPVDLSRTLAQPDRDRRLLAPRGPREARDDAHHGILSRALEVRRYPPSKSIQFTVWRLTVLYFRRRPD